MGDLLQDLRYAARTLRKSVGFATVAVLTLALAIGANVALFTVVNSVLLRPLPYPESERIVVVRHHLPGMGLPTLQASPVLIEYYRESADTLTRMAGSVERARNVSGFGQPEHVWVAEVTPEFFDVLATDPAMGRRFVDADAEQASAPVAILTHGFWQSRFAGDPGVVGRRFDVDGRSTEIVGVLPPGFTYTDRHGFNPTLFLPLWLDPEMDSFGFTGLARLAPGVDLAAARSEIAALQRRLPERFPETITEELLERAGWSASLDPLQEILVGDTATTLWVLFGAVGLVLLIAAANVANLFLVRAESRRREMAVRTALGAGAGRLARTILAESVVVGLLAGAVGVALAVVGVEMLVARGPAELPRLGEIRVDATVLAFAAALSAFSGLALGALPLPHLVRRSSAAILHSVGGRGSTAGRERHRARRLLIVGQVAMALVLLVGSGLLLKSGMRLAAVDPGFQAEGVLAVGVSLGAEPERQRATSIYIQLLDEIRGLPGVVSAGASNSLPLDPLGINGGSFAIESRPTATGALPPVAMWQAVTDGYFQTLGIRLLAGRPPARAAAEGRRPVLWVNETFARRFLDGRAIGERIRFGEDPSWAEIVGVVADVRAFGLTAEVEPTAYLPLSTERPVELDVMHFVVRTHGSPAALAPTIRPAVDRVDRSVPLTTIRTMEEILASSLAQRSFTTLLLAVAAGVALALGLVGLYGVVSYWVGQRTAEIGIRIALGAHPAAVRAMVLRQGLGVALTGVLVGLVAAVAATRLLASLLFEVSARDPATFAAVAALLLAVSLIATYLPARRATRVDPMTALRGD